MNIAIVGAKDSVEKVQKVVGLGYEKHHFFSCITGICEEFDPSLRREIAQADGVVFTGLGYVFVSRQLEKMNIPWTFISRDGSCVMKAFWDMKQLGLIPNRISIDIVNRHLVNDICKEFGLKFENIHVFAHDPRCEEQEIKNKHEALWREGEVDLVITSYGWTYDALKNDGIPVLRMEITAPIIRNSIDKLLFQVEHQSLKKSQIAVQIVDIDVHQDQNRYAYGALKKRNFIESMLIDYLPLVQGTVSQSRSYRYRIVSTRGAIESGQGETTFHKIIDVSKKKGIKLYAGVGYGHTAFDADFNARIALKKAKSEEALSYFIVDEKRQVFAPLEKDRPKYEVVVLDEYLKRIAKETGLSATYVSKIKTLTSTMDSSCIDAKKLAASLQITERSARRILKRLLDSGHADLVASSQTNNVGRPTHIYKIDWHNV